MTFICTFQINDSISNRAHKIFAMRHEMNQYSYQIMCNWRVCVCDCKKKWYIDIQYWFSFWQCHVVIANIFSVIEIICWVKSAWSGYSQRTHKHIFIGSVCHFHRQKVSAQTADKDILFEVYVQNISFANLSNSLYFFSLSSCPFF